MKQKENSPTARAVDGYLKAVRYFRISSAEAIFRYIFALLLPLGALALQYILRPYVGPISYFLLYPAVFIVIAVVGYGPGFVALTLAIVGADYGFVYPYHEIKIFHQLDSFLRFFMFAASCILTAEILRRIQTSERKLAERLAIRTQTQAQRRTQAELESTASHLEDAVRARDEFLAIASHELKTPLTTLKLQSELQARAIERGDSTAWSLERAMKLNLQTSKQVSRLTRLVEDMLDVSRINSGRLNLQKEYFDLCELVSDVVDRMRGQLNSGDQAMPKLVLCESVYGEWDRVRIEQVLINLLTNAVRYGKESTIEVRVQVQDGSAKLSVQDHGMGIAKENLERIFDRFERAVVASEISGLGLGLFISAKIMAAHGGRIGVESELGQGSVFTLELPVEGPQSMLSH